MTRDPGDPRDEPNYGIGEAAHYLALPKSTVRSWGFGQPYETKGGRKVAPPVFRPARKAPPTLSFWNVVETYVLASIRRHHGVPLQKVRKALAYVRREMNLERPLIQQQFFTDGVDLFIDRYSVLINVTGPSQLELRSLMKRSVRRIDADPKGLAVRIFPWINSPDEPKTVEIDPTRGFGRLVVAGTGIPTEAIGDRFRAGDSVDHLADDYELSRDQIEAALRWEQCAAVAA